MTMSLLFLGPFILLLLGLMLIYKSEEKQSLVENTIIGFITEFCIGGMIAQCLSILHLKISLLSVGVGYFVFALLIWIYIIRSKRIQKIYLSSWDIYAIIFIAVWFGYVFAKTFSFDLNNIYRNSDPGYHYWKAMQVVNTGKVTSSMFFSEVYNALVIELLMPFLSRINYYKAFILADTWSTILNILLFYVLTIDICKNKLTKLLLPIICFLYFMGWPFFNYIIGGYVYFGTGVTLFLYVIYLLKHFYNCEGRKQKVGCFALLLVGCYNVMICYMLFAPILGLVVIACLLIMIKQGKININRKLVTIGSVGILGAIILLVFIAYYGYFGGNIRYLVSSLQKDGGIQKELYKDFVFLLPAFLYMVVHYWRQKKVDMIVATTIVISIVILITFGLCFGGVISPYYYYKTYYLFWALLWIVNVQAIDYFMKKDMAIVIAYGMPFLFAAFMTLSGWDWRLAKKGIIVDEVSFRHMPSLFSIYDRAEIFISQEDDNLDKQGLSDICQYIDSYYKKEENNIPLVYAQYYLGPWYLTYTGAESVYAPEPEEMEEAVRKMRSEGYHYIVIHQNSEAYRSLETMFEQYDLLYTNGYYGLYRLDS